MLIEDARAFLPSELASLFRAGILTVEDFRSRTRSTTGIQEVAAILSKSEEAVTNLREALGELVGEPAPKLYTPQPYYNPATGKNEYK
jgi:hypothetical protein